MWCSNHVKLRGDQEGLNRFLRQIGRSHVQRPQRASTGYQANHQYQSEAL